MDCVSPFWNAVAATGQQQALQWTKHSWVVGMGMTSKPQGKPNEASEDNKYTVKPNKPAGKIVVTVPYLINTEFVARGTALKAANNSFVVDNRGT